MKSFVTPDPQTTSKGKTFFSTSKKHRLDQPFFQPKLAVGRVDDAYEREADAVADQVMRMADNQFVQTKISPVGVQRKATASVAHEAPAEVYQAMDGGGQAMDKGIQSFMESRFGYDFSQVRIHTGAMAAKSADTINALAYTSGNSIVFNKGQYAPETDRGKRLLAHELTHVVHQGGSDPTIQRLAVTTKPFYSDKICGEREVKWTFALDNPASADGYMVQKIEVYEIMSDGCPGISGPPAPTQTFWEAFPVMSKDKYPMLHPTLGYSDRSYLKAYPNSKGTNTSFGTIKFFLKSTTGDLGGYMTPPASKDSAWGPGKVPESGSMPSTPNEPAWWNSTPVEGPATRYATSQWDCCTDPATNNVTAFP